MSRFRNLRSVLRSVVFAAVPLLAACQCPEPTERTVVLDPDSAKLSALVDQCEQTSDCEELCTLVVQLLEGPLAAEYIYFSICELTDIPGETRPVVHYKYAPECIGGRRPDGLCDTRIARSDQVVGDWFATLSRLEGASVHAFVGIAAELHHHGAPKELVQRAIASARDEMRHTWLAGALAMRYGAKPVLPVVEPQADRSLVDFAIENAAEGCVREAFGAVVATFQGQASSDPVVRAAMTRIAEDETRHAELSIAIDRWVLTKLDPADRSRVEVARRAAIEELAASVATEPAPELIDQAGLPAAEQAAALLRHADAALWS